MNRIIIILLFLPVILGGTFPQDQDRANLFVCDSLKYRMCFKKPYDPNSQVITSRDLVADIKRFLRGRKSKIDGLGSYYLVNGRIDFATKGSRDNFYYGLVSLLIDPDIGLLQRDDLADYIIVWCSKELLTQIEAVMEKAETRDEKKILKKVKRKVKRLLKKRGY